MLAKEGFVTKKDNRNLITIDISSLIFGGHKSIFFDGSAKVVVKVEENTDK